MQREIMMIPKDEIESSLSNETRQYLVGQLAKPQKLKHLDDEHLEIGITSYESSVSEAPHFHTQAHEYQYMISGMTEYLDVETGKEYRFKKGDFYKIPPGVQYAQRAKQGTIILFIKTPPGNDKQDIEITSKVEEWLNSKVETVRQDFANDKNAPPANSIKPAAAVAIVNNSNEILLLQRKDSKKWTMPGGTLDFGEDLKTCAIREIKEELGCHIEITDIIGTYTNPNNIIAYSDGEVRQEFTLVYKGTIKSGSIELDSESIAYQWISLKDTESLAMAESQKQRMKDVVEFEENGTRAFR